MVDLETNYSGQVAFGSGISYTMTETENGVIKHTTGPRSTTHGHARQADNQTGYTKIRTSVVLHSITGGFFQIRVSFRIHAVQVKTKFIDITSIGNFSVAIDINRGGLQTGPPTYLEELHKLDNWTKGQYIPR